MADGLEPDFKVESLDALTQREWDRPWKGPFLVAMARLPNAASACRAVGISYEAWRWAKKSDPEFRRAMQEAVDIGIDLLEQTMYVRATVGEPVKVTRTRVKVDGAGKVIESETIESETVKIDNTLLVTLLRAYRPHLYRESFDLRHSLNADEYEQPPEDEVYRQPSRERMLELAQLAQRLELPAPVIEGEARRVEPSSNGDEPHE